MADPIFWLGLSVLLVAVSLLAVLVALVPTLQELARAARSAEKLFDTLSRELPPTLEAIRLTGIEISDLTDDMSQGVQSAGRVVKQVDQSIVDVRQQTRKVQRATRSLTVGLKAAWQSLMQSKAQSSRRGGDRLPPNNSASLQESYYAPYDQAGFDASSYEAASNRSQPEYEADYEDSYSEAEPEWRSHPPIPPEDIAYTPPARPSRPAHRSGDDSAQE